jgi:hypothetical protein
LRARAPRFRYGVVKNRIQYAGAGAPFRGQAEVDSIESRYDVVWQTAAQPTNEDFVVLKRHR